MGFDLDLTQEYFNPLMPRGNKKVTQVCVTFLLPRGIKGLILMISLFFPHLNSK